MFVILSLIIDLIYWLNKQFRYISDLIIGNVFDPRFDIVLVTGGVTGLGRELVLQIISKGAQVVVLDILEPLEEDLNTVGLTHYKCDVSDPQDVLRTQKLVRKEIGVVTVLINNAGIATGKPVLDLSFQEIEKTIQINLLSSFYTIKAFLPDMMLRGRGYIVTIASVLGYMSPAATQCIRCIKTGLIALHESLTYELGCSFFEPTGNQNSISVSWPIEDRNVSRRGYPFDHLCT